jgi:hypothetical protein
VDRAPAGTTFTVKIWVPTDELTLDERIIYGIPDVEDEYDDDDEVLPEALPPEKPSESLATTDTASLGGGEQPTWPAAAQLAPAAAQPDLLSDSAQRISPLVHPQPKTMSSHSMDETSGNDAVPRAVENVPVAVGESSTVPLIGSSVESEATEEPPAKRPRMGDNMTNMDDMASGLLLCTTIESSTAVMDPGNSSRQTLPQDSIEGLQNVTER